MMKSTRTTLLLCVMLACGAWLSAGAQNVRQSKWKGFDRFDFSFNKIHVTIAVPEHPAEGKPWMWRPAFFDAFAQADSVLLHRGFHIAYYDMTHRYGNPKALEQGKAFYDMMREKYGLSEKVTVEGLSRGGFYAFQWAARYPECVACVYADAPVCNLFSWPGRKDAGLWKGVLEQWGMTDEEMNAFDKNVINVVQPLIDARVPIMAVCGGADDVVPFKENMAPVFEKLTKAGVPVELIVKPGCGHHPHSLTDPTPIVDFVVRNQPAYQAYQKIQVRGDMNNSYITFRDKKKGCVAFLGGSVTAMNGWRDMIKEDLHQRFPDTQFQFIEAGMGSVGSTPDAFRLETDVLQQGMPDLMFVDAGGNDVINHFDDVAQVRGLEGIIRHALKANPYMDIVCLTVMVEEVKHLTDDGIVPDVAYNQQRVANYYKVSSADFMTEIPNRVKNGVLTWAEFGGTHPSTAGHTYYAAAINRIFDAQWNAPEGTLPKPHVVPEKPLNAFSYTNGRYLDIAQATKLKGWKIVDDWAPAEPDSVASTRKGFVHVPMLVAAKKGASFKLNFTGKAIGVFCTAGPQAADLEYSVDGKPFKTISTYTEWSYNIYLPWVYMFESELDNGPHTLVVRVAGTGKGTACQIRNFVIN